MSWYLSFGEQLPWVLDYDACDYDDCGPYDYYLSCIFWTQSNDVGQIISESDSDSDAFVVWKTWNDMDASLPGQKRIYLH